MSLDLYLSIIEHERELRVATLDALAQHQNQIVALVAQERGPQMIEAELVEIRNYLNIVELIYQAEGEVSEDDLSRALAARLGVIETHWDATLVDSRLIAIEKGILKIMLQHYLDLYRTGTDDFRSALYIAYSQQGFNDKVAAPIAALEGEMCSLLIAQYPMLDDYFRAMLEVSADVERRFYSDIYGQ